MKITLYGGPKDGAEIEIPDDQAACRAIEIPSARRGDAIRKGDGKGFYQMHRWEKNPDGRFVYSGCGDPSFAAAKPI